MKELLNKHNQRSCPMKKSIQTVPYNAKSTPWKKIFVGMLMVAVPVFVSCEKDPVKPDNNNGNGGNTQPQRTEEFMYDYDLNFWRNGSSTKIPYTAFGDTATKYGDDQTIKQIHIKPESPYMCETLNGTKMQTRANILDGIYSKSKNKLSGEETTLYLDSSALTNQTVQQILNGKLKIELLQR